MCVSRLIYSLEGSNNGANPRHPKLVKEDFVKD